MQFLDTEEFPLVVTPPYLLPSTPHSPIWAEWPLLPELLYRTASLMRSTSCWYRRLSFMAPSLASFSAPSRALTLSAVALSRFSNLGSSQRRSALSRTSCGMSPREEAERKAGEPRQSPQWRVGCGWGERIKKNGVRGCGGHDVSLCLTCCFSQLFPSP